MAKKLVIKFTSNFERYIEEIERFLTEAEAPQAYDGLLDELLETVIPNLERFPGMGRPFMLRQPRAVETTNALATLRAKLLALTTDPEALREYVLKDYLLLYVQIGGTIYLLAIRHQRQLSFDFEGHWGH
ncbi:MAG TPA: type II toxin-antitoxin system RelE/ParE family toxin [Nitrospira sp.]|uniref:type II toxin-antitoxin system RelE/ParE family toxin n=1 Tax=Accumulibacter sp. TaxID=2053492 RepID=UPI002B85C06B|nr:type II toxin-antitoxin system RelE/ParE family toxin [Accumulibacter sp.]HNG04818.1 type II toxin-antitoxin system RelE/ParE family toxin [Nitrospira sp.]HMW64258.1 type II toxin-antitoxin system RelE/ParE family toxin [Accumulibacter sp.]HNB68649.1 type II toxin-antitoxin system RelE/ParE family toxin [Accumulibacter sp.]HNK51515.1 type II toxin-antitoxin system RelE/ParE family toxin [Nitrospira sp.]HNP42162.1 type II toxin-antitoxin system RelE/ParE family toxin [Nitrospira sp.]